MNKGSQDALPESLRVIAGVSARTSSLSPSMPCREAVKLANDILVAQDLVCSQEEGIRGSVA
jgi:hypothetical protein